jgi:hypothetical protein
MDLHSNDAPARTIIPMGRFINQHQLYVAVNTAQALAVGDCPAVIPAVNDL